MMETIMMEMDAVKTVKFKTRILVQVDLQTAKIFAPFINLILYR
jgi:hypothetical protein